MPGTAHPERPSGSFELPVTRQRPEFDEELPPGSDCTLMFPVAGGKPAALERTLLDVGQEVIDAEARLLAAGVLVGDGGPSLAEVVAAADAHVRDVDVRAMAIAAGVDVGAGVRAVGTAAGPQASAADVDEALRLAGAADHGVDPPIFRELGGGPVLEVGESTVPWDGVGPDLGPVVARLAALRAAMPVPAVLVAGLAADVGALVAEVRVRRAQGPAGRPDAGEERPDVGEPEGQGEREG